MTALVVATPSSAAHGQSDWRVAINEGGMIPLPRVGTAYATGIQIVPVGATATTGFAFVLTVTVSAGTRVEAALTDRGPTEPFTCTRTASGMRCEGRASGRSPAPYGIFLLRSTRAGSATVVARIAIEGDEHADNDADRLDYAVTPAVVARCTVPRLVGLTQAAARARLARAACRVGRVTYAVGTARKGIVIRQGFRAGASIPRTTPVPFVVSRGPRIV